MSASNLATPKLAEMVLLGAAIIAVAVADVLLKKAAAHGSLEHAIRSPYLWGAIGLYLFQIGFFTYAFVSGWKLSLVGALQTALYALIVLAAGVLLYRESLTHTQVVGILLTVSGVMLINWE
jgi:multidrug transporter EmrE-like cation transporter